MHAFVRKNVNLLCKINNKYIPQTRMSYDTIHTRQNNYQVFCRIKIDHFTVCKP